MNIHISFQDTINGETLVMLLGAWQEFCGLSPNEIFHFQGLAKNGTYHMFGNLIQFVLHKDESIDSANMMIQAILLGLEDQHKITHTKMRKSSDYR